MLEKRLRQLAPPCTQQVTGGAQCRNCKIPLSVCSFADGTFCDVCRTLLNSVSSLYWERIETQAKIDLLAAITRKKLLMDSPADGECA